MEDTQNPITPQEFAKKIKAKYPQYESIDDVTLAKKMVEKYPEYTNQVDFAEKKNPIGTSTAQKKSGESVQTNGSLGTAKTYKLQGEKQPKNLPDVKGVYDSIGNVPEPKSGITIKKNNAVIQTIPLDKQKSTKEIADEKYNQIMTVDQNKINEDIADEENKNNGLLGGIKQGATNVLNAVATGMNKIGLIDETGNLKLETPFEKELKKTDPKLPPEQRLQQAKEIFAKEKAKKQIELNAENILSDASPEVKQILKTDAINKLKINSKDKAIAVQVQLLNNKLGELAKNPTPENLAQVKDLETQYQDLEKDYKKNRYDVSPEDQAKLFSLNYSSYDKYTGDLTANLAKMFGGAFNLAGELTNKGVQGMNDIGILPKGFSQENLDSLKEKNPFTQIGENFSKGAENELSKYRQVELSDIAESDNPVNTLGRWAGQTVNGIASFALPFMFGEGEAQLGAKAFIGASGAGNKIQEVNQENKDFKTAVADAHAKGLKEFEYDGKTYETEKYKGKQLYSEMQKLAVSAGYGLTDYYMAGGRLNSLKGGAKAMESALGNTVAREQFESGLMSGLQDTKAIIGSIAQKAHHGGALFAKVEASKMFLDDKILDKKVDNPIERLAKAYGDGVAMDLFAQGSPMLFGYVVSKISPNKNVVEIKSNSAKIIQFEKDFETANETDKAIIKSSIKELTDKNYNLVMQTYEQTKNMTPKQIETILDIEKQKINIKKDADYIKSDECELSPQNKKTKLAELKSKFKELDGQKLNIFDNPNSALDLLPKSEQNRLEKEAKTKIAEKQGKEITEAKFDDFEIKNTALEIHKKELNEQAKTEVAEPIESQQQAPIQENIQETTAVENAEVIQEPTNVENNEIANEGKTQGTIDANGNVSVGNGKLGESGIAKQENIEPKSVSESVNVGASKEPNEIKKSEVYHGGEIVDLKSIRDNEPFFVTESDAEAIAYSKANEGDVFVAKIDMYKIGEEEVARKILEKMGYDDEYMLHELIDPRFEDSYIGDKNLKKFYSEIKNQGYEGIKFTDTGIADKKNVTNIFLINPKETLAESGFENTKIVGERRAYDLFEEGYKPIVDDKIAENITEDELGDLFRKSNTIRMTKESPKKESFNEVEHALDQIDKGVLTWDGNINSPRIDLGMSWADIRKGEADLKRGKVDSVPAKRLLEAFNKAKEEGGYHYKLGTGGANMRSKEFVSFEDMQRATNEYNFTDAEIAEINKNEEQLAKEYDDYFNSLDEQTQNEILENYEGKSIEQGKVGENTKIGESKTNVPNEKTSGEFERKQGELSVLNRITKGGNPEKITNAIEELGTKYDVRNQDKSAQEVSKFVDEVGVVEAYKAISEGKIKNDDSIMLVYDEILQRLPKEIEKTLESISDPNERYNEEQALYNEYAKISREFAEKAKSMGQGISILNYIYNRNSELKYDLSRQIEEYKAGNKGEIPEAVLNKWKEADVKLKELNEKIKEAEARAKKAEEELAIKNIQEDIAKKSKPKTEKKPHLSTEEQKRKNELRKKFFSTLNDVTRFAIILGDPEFREYLKLTLKEARGEFKEFAQEMLKTLGKGARKYLPELYKNAGGKGEVDLKFLNVIRISKDGKISVPEQMIRDYVQEGYTEIDDLAKVLLDTIKDEHPDVDIRDIRDAITKYGKTINPSKDELSSQIRRMKRIGKLISALEDANNGERPKRSGLQRDEITQREREMKRELRDLLRDLPMEDADITKRWKTALDSVKSRLKNSIEDLEKQIANKEKSKPERNPIEYDEEAKSLKRRRDELRNTLEELVGKPELTEEQKIARTEKYLVKSIDALKEQIETNNIAFKQKADAVTSVKIESLKAEQLALRKELAELRKESGLVESKRLETAKKSVRTRISDLERRLKEGDFSKKEIKPLIPDTELSELQAEKIRIQEVFDAEKYKLELSNRKTWKKISDAILEVWNVPRILKATGELSPVLVQGGILTVSRKLTNPVELYRIMKKLFTSIGSDKKAREYESQIKAHPLYPIAEKSKLALTNPDYKTSVREEQYTGDYVNLIWDSPIFVAEHFLNKKEFANKELEPLGDKIINKFKQFLGKDIKEYEKVKLKEQWKNVNPFVALERGGTMYMNQLRFEEFVRGCEKLQLEGKNPIDHISDYKLLANAINTMTGRANIGTLATNSKTLATLFFSFRNWVSVVNQMNPAYYGYLHFGDSKINSSNWYKETSVANKLATMNMLRFITITGTSMILMKALAGKDDEGKDVIEIETDPRSSDFMKAKIGNIRFDPWHGQSTQVVFMTRMLTDQKKSTSTGEIKKLGEGYGGVKSRGDLTIQYVSNKFAPSMAMMWKYMNTHEGYDKLTKQKVRLTPYGEVYDSSDESLNLTPMYWASLKEIQAEDPNAWAEFLTVASFFGINSSVYKETDPTQRKQEELAQEYNLPESEKIAKSKEDKVKEYESEIKKYEGFIKFIKENPDKPYYVSPSERWTKEDVSIKQAEKAIEEYKKGIKELSK